MGVMTVTFQLGGLGYLVFPAAGRFSFSLQIRPIENTNESLFYDFLLTAIFFLFIPNPVIHLEFIFYIAHSGNFTHNSLQCS